MVLKIKFPLFTLQICQIFQKNLAKLVELALEKHICLKISQFICQFFKKNVKNKITNVSVFILAIFWKP
jgi:hypothetical protein